MKKLIRFSSALVAALFIGTLSAPIASAQVLINEAMIQPVSIAAADGQWIELVNTGTTAVSVNGWEVDGAVITAANPIAAGETAVICRNTDLELNGGIACDGYATFDLDPAGQTIDLLDDASQAVDSFDYSGGDVAEGQALEAIQTSSSPAANQATGSGTPGAANTQPANTVRNARTGVIYDSIQTAIDAAEAGDTLNAAAGTYQENVVINKAVTLEGADKNTTSIVATNANATTVFFAHGTTGATVRNFTITHDYTSAELADWNFNNNGVTFGQLTSGHTLDNCIVSLSRNGIYLNNNQNNTITNNTITDNRTGINMTNDLAGTEITNNVISNNWTVGLVSYFSSYTTDYSLITVTGNTFDQNWYSEVVIKDTGASTGNLNLTNNTFTDSPVTYATTTSSAFNEPGFAAQKPVSLGGSATKPEAELPTLRIYNTSASLTYNAPKTLEVGSTKPYTTIQSAITAAADGDTIAISAGTYTEAVTINKSLTLNGTGDDIGGTFVTFGSGIILLISADNVTVRDMHIGRNTLTSTAIEISGSNVSNVTFDGITATGANVGLRTGNATNIDGLTVNDSHFDGNIFGWYFAKDQAAWTAVTVTDVNVTDTTFDNNSRKGIYAEKLDNAVFTGGSANASGTDATYAFNNGVDINLKFGSYQNIEFYDFEVIGSGLMGTATLFDPAGLTIKARDDGATYGAVPASLSDVTLDGVTVSGGVVGVRIGEQGKDNTSPTGVTVVNSSLTGTGGFGIVNATQAAATLENNWWGSADPVFADVLDGDTAPTSWYINAGRTILNSTATIEDETIVIDSGELELPASTPGEAELPTDTDVLTFSNGAVLNLNQNTNTTPVVVVGGTSTVTIGGVQVAQTQTIAGLPVVLEKQVELKSGTGNSIKIQSSAPTVANVTVEVPNNTTVYAPSTWDGVIEPPVAVTTALGETAPSGYSFGGKTLKVGSDDVTLIFDKAVTLFLEGVTGSVGYKAPGGSWQLISTCGGSYAAPVLPVFPGECAISNGTDTKILTYHFTTFASLTTVADGTPATSNSSNSTGTTTQARNTSRTTAANSTSDESANGTVASEQAGTSSAETEQVAQAAESGIASELGEGNGLEWWQWSIIGLTVIGMLYYLAGDQIRQKLSK